MPPLREKRMGLGMALDVHAAIGHLFHLLPRESVGGLADDLRINEYGERKMALLQLREGFGVGAAPAVIDRDRHRVFWQTLTLAGGVLVNVAQRHDCVTGHRQISHLLAEDLAADLHPRIARRSEEHTS